MKCKKTMAILLSAAMVLSMTACGNDSGQENENADSAEDRGKITVTFGRQTTTNPKFPEGDTYEDNAYIRMVEAELNIDIVDEFEAEMGENYDRQVSLALSSGSLPDIMMVSSLDELRELYENGLIADLTEVYENGVSDYIKEIYDSYEGRALENVTFDGKIMAFPGTIADQGPSMCWVRSDWVEKLGITIDEDNDRCLTIAEVEELAKTFLEKNPEGVNDMVGIAFEVSLTNASSDGNHSMNAIAYACGAYPQLWYEKDGTLVYGSTTEKMKEALGIIQEWYNEGIVDPQLGTRTWDDITSLLTNGQLGIAFGSRHMPDWILNNVYTMNPEAVFEPYTIVDESGNANCTHADATSGFMVVSSEFEYPEIAAELLNLIYDDMVNSQELLDQYPEVATYLLTGVDGSARPVNIEVKSSTYLLDEYSQLDAALKGEAEKEDISTAEEQANYDAIMAYKEGSTEVTGWCKYHSRCKGVDMLQYLTEEELFNWVTPFYPETTKTMNTNWANLQTLEAESFIKIVTGATELESGFETFVSEWNAQGGETILSEIIEQMSE